MSFWPTTDLDGSVSAGRVIETRTVQVFRASEHQLALAADAIGQAYVAVAWNEKSPDQDRVTTSSWIGAYDARVRSLGERLPLRGVRSNSLLGLTATDSVFLVVSDIAARSGQLDDTTRMAKFAPGLPLSWVQTYGLSNADPLGTLAFGGASALVEAGHTAWSSGNIACYDVDGNATALLELPPKIQPFGIDADCNVLALEDPTDSLPHVTKFNANGNSIYSVSLARPDGSGTF